MPAESMLVVVLSLAAAVGLAIVALWMHLVYARQTRELRASEERFRTLFERAIEGVCEQFPDGRFRSANPAMARILGYASTADVVKLTAAEAARIYVSPGRRDEFFALLGASNHVAEFESEIRRPDGTTAWIEENVCAIRDPQEGLLYLQGFVTDVTRRKHAEEALRASEERYRVLFEHSPIGIVEYDYEPTVALLEAARARGVTDLPAWLASHPTEAHELLWRMDPVGVNSAMLRMIGLTSVEQGLENLARIFTDETLAMRRDILLALWAGRNEVDGEFSLRTLDGNVKRVFCRWWAPLIQGRPMMGRTQFALVDVTEIRSAERELAAQRERLSVMLRAMTEAVVAVDSLGAVQFMNEAAGRLTGWPIGAAVGRPIEDICVLRHPTAGWVGTASAVARSSDHPVDLPPQTSLQPREGAARLVQGQCAPMHDQNNRAIGALLVLRDVTERSRMEAELVRASKLESIGVLAGGIAHDFNNLLAIVTGNLALALLDERVREAGGKWLREAERGTYRAKELTQQLLTFAKGGEPVRAPVSLADVVRESAQFALHGSSAVCEYDLASDLRPADVDKGQIGQVVQNLVLNAVQAMPAGGAIRLSLRNETLDERAVATLAAGHYLRLEVSDTGEGIPSEHLSRVFEPFFTTKAQGSGLGLATVYSVVQKHCGHVTVESRAGQGTTFRIWLPAARALPVPPSHSASPFEAIHGRVLFMDDEEPIRTMTQALLERLGMEVTITSDGTTAVKEFARARVGGRPFDLVIMDLTVPGGMGGAAAMREILKIDPEARGIVSSGYSSDPVMANFRAHGFHGAVPKPYRIADFARTIRDVLSRS